MKKPYPLSYENSEPQTFDVYEQTNTGSSTLHHEHSDTFGAPRNVSGSSNYSVPWTAPYDHFPMPVNSVLGKAWSVSWDIEPGWTWYYQLRFMMIDGKETWYNADETPQFEDRTRTWADYYMDDATHKVGPQPGGGGGGN